jgi:hypothetical protein
MTNKNTRVPQTVLIMPLFSFLVPPHALGLINAWYALERVQDRNNRVVVRLGWRRIAVVASGDACAAFSLLRHSVYLVH